MRVHRQMLYSLGFSKASDKVCHKYLLHKLYHYGIHRNLLAWIKDFLSNRIHCVVLYDKQSQSAAVTSGVPQGTVPHPCFSYVL